MKKFESDLKNLIDQSDNGSVPVYLPSSDVSESSARFLAAIGTINLVPAGNNEFIFTKSVRLVICAGLTESSDLSPAYLLPC